MLHSWEWPLQLPSTFPPSYSLFHGLLHRLLLLWHTLFQSNLVTLLISFPSFFFPPTSSFLSRQSRSWGLRPTAMHGSPSIWRVRIRLNSEQCISVWKILLSRCVMYFQHNPTKFGFDLHIRGCFATNQKYQLNMLCNCMHMLIKLSLLTSLGLTALPFFNVQQQTIQ